MRVEGDQIGAVIGEVERRELAVYRHAGGIISARDGNDVVLVISFDKQLIARRARAGVDVASFDACVVNGCAIDRVPGCCAAGCGGAADKLAGVHHGDSWIFRNGDLCDITCRVNKRDREYLSDYRSVGDQDVVDVRQALQGSFDDRGVDDRRDQRNGCCRRLAVEGQVDAATIADITGAQVQRLHFSRKLFANNGHAAIIGDSWSPGHDIVTSPGNSRGVERVGSTQASQHQILDSCEDSRHGIEHDATVGCDGDIRRMSERIVARCGCDDERIFVAGAAAVDSERAIKASARRSYADRILAVTCIDRHGRLVVKVECLEVVDRDAAVVCD